MTTTPFDTLPTSTLTGKPVLHFVHANGFPSQVYAPLFEHWEQVFSIEYIELFGTHPDYPLDNHWQGLTEQVLDSIREACDKHGVPQLVAVGHSVGAVTTMQACDKDPTHISQVIALDPSLLMGKMSLAYQLSKVMDNALRPLPRFHHYFVDKISPASKSKYRKDTFDSRQIAHDSLRQKGLFRAFDARTFDGYIQHGLNAKDDKFTLAIPKAVELAIFRTIPFPILGEVTDHLPPHHAHRWQGQPLHPHGFIPRHPRPLGCASHLCERLAHVPFGDTRQHRLSRAKHHRPTNQGSLNAPS